MFSLQDSSKVVGFIAVAKAKPLVFCEGVACIVSGSEKDLQKYIVSSGQVPREFTIRKAKFIDIINAMAQGGEYAFDSNAYSSFRPVVEKNTPDLIDAKEMLGKGFITVKMKQLTSV